MKVCPECYSVYGRITPLLNPEDCLRNHRQYICSTCGRHICAAVDESGRFRALFPMRSLAIAKLYLRSAEVIFQRPCGIYEIESKNGRKLYKIFSSFDELDGYLKKNKDKTCGYTATSLRDCPIQGLPQQSTAYDICRRGRYIYERTPK